MPIQAGLSFRDPNKYVGYNLYLSTVVSRDREPTFEDYRQPETGKLYPLGSYWLVGANPTTGTEGDLWYLSKIVSNVGYWLLLGQGGTGPLIAIDVDAATAPGTNPVYPAISGLIVANGAAVANHSVPVETHTRAVNEFNIEVQYATTAAATDATQSGLAHFKSADFTADASGFISLSTTGAAKTITGDDSVALSPTANNWNILTNISAAGTTPLRTTGAVSTLTINLQKSQAIAAADATKIGLSNFNSAHFSVDSDGFVSLAGGSIAMDSIGVDANTAPGTDPVVPNGSGQIDITGAQVASATIGTNVIRTNSLAANALTIEIQRSTNNATTDVTKNGVCHFSSTDFDVDANGFVSITSSVLAQTITGQSGGALSPTAGNWNIYGASTAAGTSPVTTSGSISTLTVNVQKTQALAATDATKVGLANFNSAHFSVDANGFVELIGGGQAIDAITVDASTGPGTNPVPPSVAGLVAITGAQALAGTIANTIRSNSLAANSITMEIQRTSSAALADATLNGVAHFNNSMFTVDADGFVSLSGGSLAIDSIVVDAVTAPGVSPVTPNGSGTITITGSQATSGTINTSIQTRSTALNSLNIEIQRSSSSASANALLNGVSHFNSSMFTVDSNGFVSVSGGGTSWTVITADQTASVNNGYICNKAGLLTLTLPATASIGDTIRVTGINTALGWKIAQNANQTIHVGTSSTTTGVGGSISSINIRDTLEMVCVVAGASTEYNVISSMGTYTVV